MGKGCREGEGGIKRLMKKIIEEGNCEEEDEDDDE